jgi:geranylgeranyl reductase family protein
MKSVPELAEDFQQARLQGPAASLGRSQWEAAVVGAGPAGAMAALHLARRGRRVLLIDRARFPRDKTCGDGLIADALAALNRAGLGDAVRCLGHRMDSTSVFSPAGIEFTIPGEYVTLSRRVLDALVAREAVAAGASFCQGEVVHAEPAPDGAVRLRIRGCPVDVTARVLIVATGASAGFARQLGLITRLRPSAVGLRCYVRSRMALDHIVGAYHRSILPGYGWIFPMGEGVFNVGVVVFSGYRRGRRSINVRDAFGLFTRDFPLARQLLAEGETIAPLKGAMLRCGLAGSRLLGPGNVLAVGEAAGSTLPLLAEGVGKAMQTGQIAAEVTAEALAADDMTMLDAYPRRIEQELRSLYDGYRLAQWWITVPWLNNFMSRRVARNERLSSVLAGLIEGTCDPRQVFSARAVVRSLWW